MNIIKRLPSNLAQYVFSFDDTYSIEYSKVLTQLMYFNYIYPYIIHLIDGSVSINTLFDNKGRNTNAIKRHIHQLNNVDISYCALVNKQRKNNKTWELWED